MTTTEAMLSEGASFTDLSVERIATAAGIKRSGFYFYFRDKRELLMRLTEDVAEDLYGQAEAWWSSGEDGASALRDALGEIITAYRRHGVLLRAIVEASAYDETVAGFWRALVGRFIEATRARIEAEQSEGRVAGLPAEVAAFSLVWMTERACYQALVQGRDVAAEDFREGIVAVWTRSIYGAGV